MIKVKIEGLDKVLTHLSGMQKQVRFATAKALTQTAHAVRKEVSRAMPGELDRPKPATTRALRVEKATRDNLTAIVRLNERGEGVPAAEFLRHNVTGGRRGMKRSEIMLQAAGILPGGMFTIPGAAAKLDAYGNMSRGQIVSILSYFRTFGVAVWGENRVGRGGGLKGQALNSPRMNRAKKSRSTAAYFVVPVGAKMPAGIWQRTRSQAKPVLMFVSPGTHRKLLKLHQHGETVVRRDFNRLFDQAFADAMRTAR
jgi:hypothetical protein